MYQYVYNIVYCIYVYTILYCILLYIPVCTDMYTLIYTTVRILIWYWFCAIVLKRVFFNVCVYLYWQCTNDIYVVDVLWHSVPAIY